MSVSGLIAHDNAPPQLHAITDLIGMLALLSNPDGLKQLAAKITALRDDALNAYAALAGNEKSRRRKPRWPSAKTRSPRLRPRSPIASGKSQRRKSGWIARRQR
jgi:hypothetical protein